MDGSCRRGIASTPGACPRLIAVTAGMRVATRFAVMTEFKGETTEEERWYYGTIEGAWGDSCSVLYDDGDRLTMNARARRGRQGWRESCCLVRNRSTRLRRNKNKASTARWSALRRRIRVAELGRAIDNKSRLVLQVAEAVCGHLAYCRGEHDFVAQSLEPRAPGVALAPKGA